METKIYSSVLYHRHSKLNHCAKNILSQSKSVVPIRFTFESLKTLLCFGTQFRI